MVSESIFISYRRDGGEAMAQLLYEHFSRKGYDVFYDIETMNSCEFDVTLLKEIEKSDYVVVVLPPQALDRCCYEDDWVRQEIRHALSLNKIIVPVMMRGFEFPPDLPEDIARLSKCNGVMFDNMNYFEAKINRVIQMFNAGTKHSTFHSGGGTRQPAGPSMISTICSVGGTNEKELWPPADRKFSSIISLDEYCSIIFQVLLVNPIEKDQTLPVGYNIFDESGSLVKSNKLEVSFRAGNDRFATNWIIRGADGTFIKPGVYTVEMWIADSRTSDYQFAITSSEHELIKKGVSKNKQEPQKPVTPVSHYNPPVTAPKPPVRTTPNVNPQSARVTPPVTTPQPPISDPAPQENPKDAIKKRIKELRDLLSRPRGLIYCLIVVVSLLLFIFSFGSEIYELFLISLFMFAVSWVLLIIYTCLHGIGNSLVRFLLTTVGVVPYLFVLLFKWLLSINKRESAKLELIELKRELKKK